MLDSNILFIALPALFVLGACMGSFLTMASWRIPRDEEIVFTPSHCTGCGATLKMPDLVPVLSWACTRGRCRHCHAKVSARYPLIELSMGIGFVVLALCFGLTFKTLILCFLFSELVLLIVTDLEHTIIPDSVQMAMFFTGIAWCIGFNRDWEDVLISSGLGLGLGLALHYGYKWLRHKDGLGWADVKFLCVAGVWLPLESFVPFLFVAGVLGTMTGLVWGRLGRGPVFPFGPALAVSLFINLLYPNLFSRLIAQ